MKGHVPRGNLSEWKRLGHGESINSCRVTNSHRRLPGKLFLQEKRILRRTQEIFQYYENKQLWANRPRAGEVRYVTHRSSRFMKKAKVHWTELIISGHTAVNRWPSDPVTSGLILLIPDRTWSLTNQISSLRRSKTIDCAVSHNKSELLLRRRTEFALDSRIAGIFMRFKCL